MLMFVLTEYSGDYLSQCVRMYYNLFTREPWNYSWLKKEQIARYFLDLEKTPGFQGYVYLHDGKTAGACFGIIDDYFQSSQYFIKEIFLDGRIQGKGFGTSFLHEIESELYEKGICYITLITQKTIPAYNFYIKNNFDVSNDTAYMVKPLQI